MAEIPQQDQNNPEVLDQPPFSDITVGQLALFDVECRPRVIISKVVTEPRINSSELVLPGISRSAYTDYKNALKADPTIVRRRTGVSVSRPFGVFPPASTFWSRVADRNAPFPSRQPKRS